MTQEFHRTKPLKIFNGKNMDIFIESTYPKECFGAPKQYVAYLTKGHSIKALGVGNTDKELLNDIQKWIANILVYCLIKDDIEKYKEQIQYIGDKQHDTI